MKKYKSFLSLLLAFLLLNDENLSAKIQIKETMDLMEKSGKSEKDNPYGVPIGLGNWAGGGALLNFGTTLCFANKYFPDIIDANHAFKVSNFLFGCHPYHNYSLVAAVGAARPKAVFYGNNRADFSFIPGNVAPGMLFRKPDHFENYDDWPFLWGQNEGTIAGNVLVTTDLHGQLSGIAFVQLIERQPIGTARGDGPRQVRTHSLLNQ